MFKELYNVKAFDISNSLFVETSDTLKHFWKTKVYDDDGCLLLALLDIVVKEKSELRDLISQLLTCINKLKIF